MISKNEPVPAKSPAITCATRVNMSIFESYPK